MNEECARMTEPPPVEYSKLFAQLHRFATENASLREQVDRLTTLLDVSSAIFNELDLDRLLVTIMRHVTRAMVADRSTLFILDANTKMLRSKVAQGTQEIMIPLGTGLAGWVAQSGKSLNIPDAYNDERFNPEVDKKTGYHTRSLLVVPFRNRQSETLGVVQIINRLDRDFFTEEDEQFLQSLTVPIALSVENARLYTELRIFFKSVINAMADTIDARHKGTAGHTRRVTEYCLGAARQLHASTEEMEILEYSAVLHDFGKIGVPEAILTKPGRLTPEELTEIRKHARYTIDILSRIQFPGRFTIIPTIAGHHHEKVDGSGYPDALKGDQIHWMSKVMAVADVFDAITAPREYRAPVDPEKAFEILHKDTGSHFDAEAVEAFLRWAEETKLVERLRVEYSHLYGERKPDQDV